MRQWNVNPKLMCRKHLLGEHVETHMFASCINKKKKLDGFIDGGLLEIHTLRNRHSELVKEMKARGYKHKSPLVSFSKKIVGKINVTKNIKELKHRCKECKTRIRKGCNHSVHHSGPKKTA